MTCTDKHKMRNSTSREQVFKHFLCRIGFFDYFCHTKTNNIKTQNDMIHAQKGDSWNFQTKYETDSYKIEYKELINYFKDGPLGGDLYINDKLVNPPEKHSVFGGPPLITEKFLYTTIWQYDIHGFKDISGGLIAEINLQDLSTRIIGKKQHHAQIVYIDNGKIYYLNQRNKLKSLDINEAFIPRTFQDVALDTLEGFRDLFKLFFS